MVHAPKALDGPYFTEDPRQVRLRDVVWEVADCTGSQLDQRAGHGIHRPLWDEGIHHSPKTVAGGIFASLLGYPLSRGLSSISQFPIASQSLGVWHGPDFFDQ